jgi:hypothetical protein
VRESQHVSLGEIGAEVPIGSSISVEISMRVAPCIQSTLAGVFCAFLGNPCSESSTASFPFVGKQDPEALVIAVRSDFIAIRASQFVAALGTVSLLVDYYIYPPCLASSAWQPPVDPSAAEQTNFRLSNHAPAEATGMWPVPTVYECPKT